MKLPRDVDARRLIKALARIGYGMTCQSGSPIRPACTMPTPHSITVPRSCARSSSDRHGLAAR